jgi:hypothetical protein
MILLHVIILGSFVWLHFKKSAGDHKVLYGFALLFKLSMGIALGLVYRYYYQANDTWLFFEDAGKLADLASEDFKSYIQFLWRTDKTQPVWHILANTQERSLFFVKIVSGFALISGNSYWIAAIYFSFISFISCWYFFQTVVKNFAESTRSAALAFLFFPSVIFWSSGIVKETIALAGLYCLASVFIKIIKGDTRTWVEWAVMLCSFYVAWSLKYYWTALFMAVVTTSLIMFLIRKRVVGLHRYKLISWVVIFFTLSAIASLLHPNFYLSRFLDVLVTNHNDFVKISRPDAIIHYYQLTASWLSIFINAPWALCSGLFRPFIIEANGLIPTLASLENLVLLVLTGACFFRRKAQPSDRLLFFSTVVYVVLLCVFLALSTPNLGTLSRYRVGFLPFFTFIISYRNPLLQYLFDRISFLRT